MERVVRDLESGVPLLLEFRNYRPVQKKSVCENAVNKMNEKTSPDKG